MKKQVCIAYCLLAVVFFICQESFAAAAIPKTQSTRCLGWPVAVTVWAQDDLSAQIAVNAVVAELGRIEQKFSAYRQGSIINTLNQYASEKPVTVDNEVFKLLNWANLLSEKTKGEFDITTAVFAWQYGFGQRDFRIPPDLQLEGLRQFVGHKYLALYPEDKTVLFKRQGLQIDLEPIIINYALNQVRSILEKCQGVSACLRMGENVIVTGAEPQPGLWKIPLYLQPNQPSAQPFASTSLKTEKLLQAGMYDRAFLKDGQWVHIHLDAKTGKPARYALKTWLRLPKNPSFDLPAAILMLLPPEQGLALVATIPGAECLIVDVTQKTWKSPGWDN